ncbi:hypothetical protein V1511DRAFT_498345 [Dipodascopsis uninucleata]
MSGSPTKRRFVFHHCGSSSGHGSGGSGSLISPDRHRVTELKGIFENGIWKCNCDPRQPAALRQVQKQTANHGRMFYTCPSTLDQCGFFLWEEDAKIREGPPVQSKASQHSTMSMSSQYSRHHREREKERNSTGTSWSDDEKIDRDEIRKSSFDLTSERSRNYSSERGLLRTPTRTSTFDPSSQLYTPPETTASTNDTLRSSILMQPLGVARDLSESSLTLANIASSSSSSSSAAIAQSASTAELHMLLQDTRTKMSEMINAIESKLTIHDRVVQGVVRGRDSVRTALSEKDMIIADLKQEIGKLTEKEQVYEAMNSALQIEIKRLKKELVEYRNLNKFNKV